MAIEPEAAILLSVLAMASKTPLTITIDKIVWNFAVGGMLGLLVPLIAST